VQNAATQPCGAGPFSPQKGSGQAVDTNLLESDASNIGETFNIAWYLKKVEENSLNQVSGPETIS
jgi:hypothetical protein